MVIQNIGLVYGYTKYRPIKNAFNIQIIGTNFKNNNCSWEYFADWTNCAALSTLSQDYVEVNYNLFAT